MFSVEPGIYLAGETGVRIEDLVHLDATRGIVERLTQFPRDVIVAAGLTGLHPLVASPAHPTDLAPGVRTPPDRATRHRSTTA